LPSSVNQRGETRRTGVAPIGHVDQIAGAIARRAEIADAVRAQPAGDANGPLRAFRAVDAARTQNHGIPAIGDEFLNQRLARRL
jgi:hypothetical protein